jgi:hypothetical protein
MFSNIKDVDALDKLLFVGIFFFAGVLLVLAKWDADDGQTFQVISGLLTGFSGAFFARLKPKPDTTPGANTATVGPTNGTNK